MEQNFRPRKSLRGRAPLRWFSGGQRRCYAILLALPGATRQWLLAWTAVLTLVGCLLSAASLAVMGKYDALAVLAEIGRIVFTLGMLASALLMLCRWRFRDEPASGWSAAFLLAAGGYLRTEEMNDSLFLSATAQRSVDLVLPTDVMLLVFLMWLCLCAARGVPPVGWRHPVLVGVSGGALLSLARLLWFEYAPPLPDSAVMLAVVAVYVLTAWVSARAFLRIDEFPWDARLTVVVAMVGGMAVHHFSPVDLTSHPLWSVSVMAVCTTAGVTLVATSFHLVWTAWTEQSQRLLRLDEQAEQRLHDDEDFRHECRATIAGINNASRLLMSANTKLPADRRHSLEEMLEAEMARLEDLLQTPECERTMTTKLHLDELLRPLVMAHSAQGAVIRYHADATIVHAQATHVSRAINTVLSNARRHAPDATVTISTEVNDAHVALRVQDDGPGVPSHLGERVFARYSKGAHSVGEGIGLYAARHALRDLGGDLVLEPTDRGASFVLLLPR